MVQSTSDQKAKRLIISAMIRNILTLLASSPTSDNEWNMNSALFQKKTKGKCLSHQFVIKSSQLIQLENDQNEL